MDKVVDKHWFWELPWNSIVPVLIAVIGYALVHYLTARRDSRNKKREIRASFLTESYQKLALIVSSPDKWSFEDLQLVLVGLQLMGTNSQIDKAEKIAERCSVAFNNPKDSSIDLEPLLIDIRNDLREELSMEKTDGSFIWLKAGPISQKDKK